MLNEIITDAEYKALCSMIYKDFEKVGEYIRTKEYLQPAVTEGVTSSERDKLLHRYNNLGDVIQIVKNAAVKTAEINI